jgi:hypothetical protein
VSTRRWALLMLREGHPAAQAALRGRDSLTGTFDYQASDDKICCNPMSVHLTWTLSLHDNTETSWQPAFLLAFADVVTSRWY